jgi:hypothetical protein
LLLLLLGLGQLARLRQGVAPLGLGRGWVARRLDAAGKLLQHELATQGACERDSAVGARAAGAARSDERGVVARGIGDKELVVRERGGGRVGAARVVGLGREEVFDLCVCWVLLWLCVGGARVEGERGVENERERGGGGALKLTA